MIINDRDNYDKVKQTIKMDNLRTIMNNKGYTTVKLATNICISTSAINAYLNGQKIPSITTLVAMADYLNCNIDYLIGRTNNPIPINDIKKISNDETLNMLINNIKSLPKEKQDLVDAFIKGLMNFLKANDF